MRFSLGADVTPALKSLEFPFYFLDKSIAWQRRTAPRTRSEVSKFEVQGALPPLFEQCLGENTSA